MESDHCDLPNLDGTVVLRALPHILFVSAVRRADDGILVIPTHSDSRRGLRSLEDLLDLRQNFHLIDQLMEAPMRPPGRGFGEYATRGSLTGTDTPGRQLSFLLTGVELRNESYDFKGIQGGKSCTWTIRHIRMKE